jgi:hypothetical protein
MGAIRNDSGWNSRREESALVVRKYMGECSTHLKHCENVA